MQEKLVTDEFCSWLEEACPGTLVKAVTDEEICERALDWFDAVLFPGSVGSVLCVEKFGEQYRATVREWVRRGGCYIGVCGGCYAAVSQFKILGTARIAVGGIARYPALLKNTLSDLTSFDKQIGRKTGRASGAKMLSALLKGKIRTFDLIDAKARTPAFFGDPYFLRHRWSKLVTDGTLLKVNVRIASETTQFTAGHEDEVTQCAYSGGALLEQLGSDVTPIAYYDLTATMPETDGKVAMAAAKFGRGQVIVSGPDFFIPFQTDPGVVIRKGMEPSIDWLTSRILSANSNAGRSG